MTARIVPLLPRHVRGFHAALDGVAREGRFLAMTEAPPLAAARRFIRNGVAAGSLQFVALIDDTVVGWCDISRLPHAAQRHSGTLGMGVVAAQRGRGIGRALLDATLARADETGLMRVELRVRNDNVPAIRLYERSGFEVEGTCRRYLQHEGAYYDALIMARLR